METVAVKDSKLGKALTMSGAMINADLLLQDGKWILEERTGYDLVQNREKTAFMIFAKHSRGNGKGWSRRFHFILILDCISEDFLGSVFFRFLEAGCS